MRPKLPILAITHDERVRRGLSLNYGVIAHQAEKKATMDEMLDDAVNIAKELGLVKAGDVVVISAGSMAGKGNTDLMKVRVVA